MNGTNNSFMVDYSEYEWMFYYDDEDEYQLYVSASKILEILRFISYTVTIIVGITANSLVIWIAGFKMKSISSVWFFNLAITDFICNIALLLRLIYLALAFIGMFVDVLHYVNISFMLFNMITSIYFLTIISIDRYVSVIFPLWAKIYRTPRLARILSGVIWLVSLIVSVTYMFLNVSVYIEYFETFVLADESLKDETHALLIVRFIFLFAVPFFIILICYCLIALKMKSRNRPTESQRAFKVIIAIVFCFFICWCPNNIMPFIKLNRRYRVTHYAIYEFTVLLTYINSCINPILYVFLCQEFKDNFIKSLPSSLRKVFNKKN